MGRLNPGGQVYQASGESTPSARLPDKYVSTAQPPSPLSAHLAEPSGYLTRSNSAIVLRAPRMKGMRYLYQRGMTRMPVQHTGASAVPYPWISNFNRNEQGPIRNGGFNDALFQAGYPGFNLGLSFKVPTLDNQALATRQRMRFFAQIRTKGAEADRVTRASNG